MPLFKFGAVADVQYCDRKPHKTRFYRQSPGKFESCVQELNSRNLDFTIHLGDFIDQDFVSYDTAFAVVEVYDDHLNVIGFGREPSRVLRY